MASTFPKVKKSSSWKTSSAPKEVVYVRHLFIQTESHKTNITVESPSEWTSTTPFVGASESIKPNGNDFELNAIGDTFLRSSSLKCSKLSKQTFTVPSLAIMNTFPSSVFSSEENKETKKIPFSPVEDFTPGGIQEHKNLQAHQNKTD